MSDPHGNLSGVVLYWRAPPPTRPLPLGWQMLGNGPWRRVIRLDRLSLWFT